MNLIIKSGLIALFVIVPSLAHATFLKSPQPEEGFENFTPMNWHRAGAEKPSLLPMLKQLFERGRERSQWLKFLPVEKKEWSKPKLSFIDFGHNFDFRRGGKWHHRDWTKCHEVPLPAAWPLFSLALFSLGLIKRYRK